MGLEQLVGKYAKQSVVVLARSGFDQYGSPTFPSTTAASTYAALVIPKIQSIRTRNGVDKISTSQIYLSGNTTISIEDKITLPDATTPLILAVQKYPAFDGSTDIL